jgi:hypothetical protein
LCSNLLHLHKNPIIYLVLSKLSTNMYMGGGSRETQVCNIQQTRNTLGWNYNLVNHVFRHCITRQIQRILLLYWSRRRVVQVPFPSSTFTKCWHLVYLIYHHFPQELTLGCYKICSLLSNYNTIFGRNSILSWKNSILSCLSRKIGWNIGSGIFLDSHYVSMNVGL